MLGPKEIQIILNKISEWKSEPKGSVNLLYLLVHLDRLFAFDDSITSLFSSKYLNTYYFTCLNQNENDGYLLPRFKSNWNKNNRRSKASLEKDPLSVMENYFWVEHPNDWKIENIYSPSWTCPTNTSFTVVFSPITNQSVFEYELKDDDTQNTFEIVKYHSDPQTLLLERLEKILAYANSVEANMLFFPEMISSRESQLALRQITSNHWEYAYPRIICLPSSEFFDHGVWRNQTIVLDDSGHELYSYNKQQPFQLDHKPASEEGSQSSIPRKYFEPIVPDHRITIMHINGVGRIGIIICADVFKSDLIGILCKYEIRLLLIMAYTAGYDQFFRDISFAQSYFCDVIWCNSCSAYTDFSKTGPSAVYFSYGHKRCDKNDVQCPCLQNQPCPGCAFTVSIAPSYSGEGSIHHTSLEEL